MEESKLYTARVQVVEAMEQGFPWHEAAKRAGLQISQSTAYRLRQRMRQGGKQALREGRHGHPAKLRGEVRTFLEQTCRQAPSTPSHEIQTQLAQQFSQEAQCESNQPRSRHLRSEQSASKREKKVTSPAGGPEWQEGAGGLLLLAAAHETALLSQLEEVLPMKPRSLREPEPSLQRLFPPQRSLLLTLLFLPAVGLRRFWELRSYTGGELAVLTGRSQPYSYRHTERFLLQLSAAQADQALTQALARWTAAVWQVEERTRGASSPSFYVDGHRKPVYTETLIPRGLIGRLGKIAGCRALVLLHDEQGHPRHGHHPSR
jgi:transposase